MGDILYAESIADIKENAPQLRYPAFRGVLIRHRYYVEPTYILINNVGIDRLKTDSRVIIPDFFAIHDDSGTEMVYWKKGEPFLGSVQSFEDAQEEQGLEDRDWVFEIILRYVTHERLRMGLSVFEVRKSNFSNPKKEKTPLLDEVVSLIEKIKRYIPGYPPAPQPVPY